MRYKNLGKHFQDLYKNITPIKGGKNAEIVNYMIFKSIPAETVRVIEGKKR